MFDFAWSEIALIGVVALIAIGPKDMPVAIRAMSDVIKKMRRMAGEFQHHVDDMLRDADLQDVKSSFDELRSMNFKGSMRRTLDPDGTLGRAFEDPFRENPVKPVMTSRDPALALPAPPVADAPAFIPPETPAPAPIQPEMDHASQEPPAFIPPQWAGR